MQHPIKNIAGYQFITIEDITSMRLQVQNICDQTHLKGTIFISPEGINLSLAGSGTDIDFAIEQLNSECGFKQLLFNTTYSAVIPFRRLLVKAREELVPTGSALDQADKDDQNYMTSEMLKQWLDEGKDFTLLDLRNSYEFELGSFDGAQHLQLKYFRDLENACSKLNSVPTNKPIVTFCTGGIRCEKGAAYIAQHGFDQVHQLKGGILDYLQKFRHHHWHGDCFVFDERVSLDHELNPTYAKLCRSCQTALHSIEERFCSACVSLI
jgi:UPF0176 protein